MERVDAPVDTTGEEAPEGHDESMVKRFEQSTEQAVETDTRKDEERPEWLDKKFNSVEDMAKAYRELEKKLSQGNKENIESKESTDQAEQAEEAVRSAGLNMDALQQEYAEKGGLTDESYQALEKAGITKEIVDSYIQGQEAIAEQIRQNAYNLVGGQNNYKAMADWAVNNLSQSELDAYNIAVEGTPEQINLAINGLYSRYVNANGKRPSLVAGEATRVSNGFESRAQIVEAMKDPRYKNDPAYRRQIEERLMNTSIL